MDSDPEKRRLGPVELLVLFELQPDLKLSFLLLRGKGAQILYLERDLGRSLNQLLRLAGIGDVIPGAQKLVA
jgi:hypothetical protein